MARASSALAQGIIRCISIIIMIINIIIISIISIISIINIISIISIARVFSPAQGRMSLSWLKYYDIWFDSTYNTI